MASAAQNGTVVGVGDGSWLLSIYVTDLKRASQLRVRGDLHIGGLMLRLVEHVDITRDWSDHALWWPARRKWLTHTRSTLDQLGVGADTDLEFTPMHKVARVQLPDLQMIDARLDYSVPVFSAAVTLCKELGVRYPEELSLKRYIAPDRLKRGLGFEEDSIRAGVAVPLPGQLKRQTPISASVQNMNGQQHTTSPSRAHTPGFGGTLDNRASSMPRAMTPTGNYNTLGSPSRAASVAPSGVGTMVRSPITPSFSWGDTLSAGAFDQALVHSPLVSNKLAAQAGLFRPKDYEQKAALNRGWLDSSRSLMEQGVFEGDVVLLRFKFTQFFDLNSKYDPVRINQLYEQAKWSVLYEELDSTDEEAMLFAALQLQVQLQSGAPETEDEENGPDVDILLDELEQQLDVAAAQRRQDITSVPELTEYLRYFKPKRLTLKGWKRGFFVFRDLSLSYYTSATDAQGPPLGRISLKGCEVSPDINLQANKYGIKLLVPSAEGMNDFHLKCDSEHQYIRWMAGCRLAARGKTMADSDYNAELDSIKRLLAMQNPATAVQSPRHRVEPTRMPDNFEPEEFVTQKTFKSKGRNAVEQRISEAHSNVRSLSGVDAKLQYIRAWQSLPEHGIHYFIVRFRGSKKNELLGIAFNRMMRMNPETADTLKTWRFSTMKKWHVNWEIKHVLAQLEEENVEFKPVSADCKVAHEFIGGYIFLSLRSKEHNPSLNEHLFHKLTGGHHGGMVNVS